MTNRLIVSFCTALILCACSGKNEELASSESAEEEIAERKRIVFFGNSLTAGYGLSEENSLPTLVQKRVDSLKLPYEVINAGVSGETTTGGLGRLDWVLKEKCEVFVLELGANDGLRGIEIEYTKQNLITIIKQVKEAMPDVRIVLAGMTVPPSMGETYQKEFTSIFPAIAEEEGVALIPFWLEGVAGHPDLLLEDALHPNEAGQEVVLENVWETIAPILK